MRVRTCRRLPVRARRRGRSPPGRTRSPADAAIGPQPPPADWPEVGELTPRAKRGERKEAQSDLDLPAYPTTTTGSLPQTAEVRQLRVRLGKVELEPTDYEAEMARLITDGVAGRSAWAWT